MTRPSIRSTLLTLIPITMLDAGCAAIPGDVLDDNQTVDCFWELTVTGNTEAAGSYAVHSYAGEILPFFNISLTDPNSLAEPGGLIGSTPGPSAGQSGMFDGEIRIVSGDRAWLAGEDAEDTFANISIDRNTTAEVQGIITGMCETESGGERVIRSFTLSFRSAHGIAGAPGCSPN